MPNRCNRYGWEGRAPSAACLLRDTQPPPQMFRLERSAKGRLLLPARLWLPLPSESLGFGDDLASSMGSVVSILSALRVTVGTGFLAKVLPHALVSIAVLHY